MTNAIPRLFDFSKCRAARNGARAEGSRLGTNRCSVRIVVFDTVDERELMSPFDEIQDRSQLSNASAMGIKVGEMPIDQANYGADCLAFETCYQWANSMGGVNPAGPQPARRFKVVSGTELDFPSQSHFTVPASRFSTFDGKC
jgi:hypothetical protein